MYGFVEVVEMPGGGDGARVKVTNLREGSLRLDLCLLRKTEVGLCQITMNI